MFEKGKPNIKEIQKNIEIVLSVKQSETRELLFEMRQCVKNDFKDVKPVLTLVEI